MVIACPTLLHHHDAASSRHGHSLSSSNGRLAADRTTSACLMRALRWTASTGRPSSRSRYTTSLPSVRKKRGGLVLDLFLHHLLEESANSAIVQERDRVRVELKGPLFGRECHFERLARGARQLVVQQVRPNAGCIRSCTRRSILLCPTATTTGWVYRGLLRNLNLFWDLGRSCHRVRRAQHVPTERGPRPRRGTRAHRESRRGPRSTQLPPAEPAG